MSREEIEGVKARLADRPADAPLDARRAGLDGMAAAMADLDGLRVEEVDCDGVPALWVTVAGQSPDGAVLWLHGGAFTVGSAAAWRDWAGRLARVGGVGVLLPDYRLTPEHPFPAGLDDAHTALDWLERERGPARVAIGGDSAGGNLAVVAVQDRLDAGRPVPAAVALTSPYLDLAHTGASIAARAHRDPWIDPAGMAATAAAYLSDADPTGRRASPLHGPVEGFPPTLIQVGADEVLFDDARRFAARLEAAGRPIVFQEWIGLFHDWPFFAPVLEEGRWATAQAAHFVADRVSNR